MNKWELSNIVDEYLESWFNDFCCTLSELDNHAICAHDDGTVSIMPLLGDEDNEFKNKDGMNDIITVNIRLPEFLDQLMDTNSGSFEGMSNELKNAIITKLETLITFIKSVKE